MGDPVLVTEVGPRDGLQIAPGVMPVAQRIAWVQSLADAGLRAIEVGSFVPPKLVPQMAGTEAVVAASLQIPGLWVLALAPNLRGAQAAYEAGAHAINIPVSVSRAHSLSNTNKTPEEQVAEVGRIAEWVRAQPRRMAVEATASTAFGCSMEGAIPVERVVATCVGLAEAGVDAISLADTVGYGNPALIRQVVRAVNAEIGETLRTLHLHDTMGLGLANVLAGLEEGIRSFDSALAGLGGCPFAPGAAGNITTEDLVFMLESMGLSTGIDLARLIATREVLLAGLPDVRLRGAVAQAGIPKTYIPKTCIKAA